MRRGGGIDWRMIVSSLMFFAAVGHIVAILCGAPGLPEVRDAVH